MVEGRSEAVKEAANKQMKWKNEKKNVYTTNVIFIFKKIAVRKLNKYCRVAEEMKPKRENWRDRKEIKLNEKAMMWVQIHICLRFTYTAIVPHTYTYTYTYSAHAFMYTF